MHDRSNRRHADPHPQREPARAREGRRCPPRSSRSRSPAPQGRGLRRGLPRIEDGRSRSTCCASPQVRRRSRARDLRHGAASRSPVGACTRQGRRLPQGPRRAGHRDPLHLARRDDRPQDAQSAASAAKSSASSGREPRTCRGSEEAHHAPARRRGRSRRATPSRVEGPQGHARAGVPHEMTVSVDDGRRHGHARPTDRGAHRSLHGLTRSLVANMVQGVTNGYEKRLEIVGVGYRAALQGNASSSRSASRTPSSSTPPDGHRVRDRRRRRRSSCAASTSRPSARSPPTSARLRPPEPYKGKGIRYAGEHIRRKVGKRASRNVANEQKRRRAAGTRRVRGPRRCTARRASAPGRVPHQQGHLRPGHRRRRGRHARLGLDPRAGRARVRANRRGAAEVGKLVAQRAARPASPRSSSTAAATSTTGASRRSLTAPARAARVLDRDAFRSRRCIGRRAPGARRRDQPRGEGRQGRPPLLVHGARRRG